MDEGGGLCGELPPDLSLHPPDLLRGEVGERQGWEIEADGMGMAWSEVLLGRVKLALRDCVSGTQNLGKKKTWGWGWGRDEFLRPVPWVVRGGCARALLHILPFWNFYLSFPWIEQVLQAGSRGKERENYGDLISAGGRSCRVVSWLILPNRTLPYHTCTA